MIDFVSLTATQDPPPLPPLTDARELLTEFATTGRQEPFEEVVRRYGGMVFNLCFEVTGNRHDAEDAVQAAFLSLAVQTKSGQPVQAIGPWLQQVARRMSLDINRSRKRRKAREEKHANAWEARLTEAAADGNGNGHGNPVSAAGWDELRHVVQQELDTLPAKYRMPLILHYYGGMSREEMARELNCRANTLGVRLHRGRDMLAKRLAKRGVTLSGVIIGVVLTEVCRSIVTEKLVFSTAQAAVLLSAGHPYACGVVSPQIVALAQSATRALANAKIRFAASLAILAGGAAAAGAQVVSHVGSWRLPNLDLGNLVRKMITPSAPRLKPGFTQQTSQPAPKDVAMNPTPNATPAAPRLASVPAFARIVPLLQWKPLGRSVFPQFEQVGNDGFAFSQSRPANDPLPLPSPVEKKLNGGTAVVQSQNRSTIKSLDQANAPQNKSNSQTPADGRGGVKPVPNDIAKNGSPKPNGDAPNVGGSNNTDVANEFPNPLPKDVKPGPIIGPVYTRPPAPPPDAQQIDEPIPAGDIAPHGGFLSDDVLHISSDYNPSGAESFDQIALQGLSAANFKLGAGETATNKEVIVGYMGTGVATQVGGLHTVDSLYLGVIKTGHGQYQLTGGELSVTASPLDPDAAAHTIEIGSAGEGSFLLGNTTSTGRITQTGDGGGVNLTVGAIRSAKGTLRGWGTVALTGTLSNNGQIIADGYGQDRTLDLSTFATITNDFANRDTKGWFAVNHGRLDLPAIAVSAGTNTYTWGGNSDDTNLSLVNSARMTLNGVQGDGVVKIALMALDRTDIPKLPDGHHFIGVWSFDATDSAGGALVAAGGMDLTIRYDDALAAQLGLDQNVLKLWKYDGQWERLDFDPTFTRDLVNHTLSVHTDIAGAEFFAVSAPEPGSVSLVVLGAGLWLGKRRRKLAH